MRFEQDILERQKEMMKNMQEDTSAAADHDKIQAEEAP